MSIDQELAIELESVKRERQQLMDSIAQVKAEAGAHQLEVCTITLQLAAAYCCLRRERRRCWLLFALCCSCDICTMLQNLAAHAVTAGMWHACMCLSTLASTLGVRVTFNSRIPLFTCPALSV
jgi:hypothetical protein